MSYPFQPMPTFKEFIEELGSGFDCEYIVDDSQNSFPYPIKYIERSINGHNTKYVLDFDDDNTRMTPSLVRSVLRRLNIDPKDFGFNLD